MESTRTSQNGHERTVTERSRPRIPLAQSHGRILELARALKAKQSDKGKKLFKFLSDIGTRALRIHIGRVLEMSESSVAKGEYEAKVKARFGSPTVKKTLTSDRRPNQS